MRRQRMTKQKSKKLFKKTASRTNKMNMTRPGIGMRGGRRL